MPALAESVTKIAQLYKALPEAPVTELTVAAATHSFVNMLAAPGAGILLIVDEPAFGALKAKLTLTTRLLLQA